MIPRGRARARTALLVGFLALAAAAPMGAERPRLELSVAGPAIEGGEVEVRVAMHGALADRRVTFTVTVDSETVARFDAEGPAASHRFSHPLLTPGIHELGIRTGTEFARIELRVLPRWTVPAALAGLALLVGGLVAAVRIRRARARSGA